MRLLYNKKTRKGLLIFEVDKLKASKIAQWKIKHSDLINF